MTTPDPNYVINLAQRLAQARTELQRLESAWQALFTGRTLQPATLATEDGHGVQQDGPTLATRILALMAEHPSRAFTTAEVSAALDARPTSVASILSRLVRRRQIEKHGHGRYSSRVEKSLAEVLEQAEGAAEATP